MRKFTRCCCVVLLICTIFFTNAANAQCAFTSSTGYTVTVNASPVSIIAPSICPFGYNYNLTVLYNISFSGTNIPANLYTLQGNIYCGAQPNFFSLPLSGGTGSVNTSSNPYINTANCATATIATLNCNSTQIIINGPGLATQSSFCAAGGPLPVTLVSFNAMLVNTNSVYLSWVTANETSNKSFTVERSTDGTNWSAVTTITGAVNSSTSSQYQYTDAALAIGMYYYRLKQTNLTGTISYSNIIGARIKTNNTAVISLVQNSADQLFISGLANSKYWSLTMLNTAGAAVLYSAALHSNIVQLPLISRGIYIVKLQNAVTGEGKVLKFLKN